MQGSKTGNFLKGLGAGMVAGATAVVVGKVMMNKNNHNVSKGSAKVVKAVGEIVDGVQTIFH
ncbi:MAG: hypothetical protein J6J13_03455 [Clostridia bacterium]|nr:hypothetical protein [Clostridia bacterium]